MRVKQVNLCKTNKDQYPFVSFIVEVTKLYSRSDGLKTDK